MSLVSPRFNSSGRLLRAAGGETVRQGANGRHVHLVQAALIDLGYPMPRSTNSAHYSPDGSFGNETQEKLIAFQNANNITPSGSIDRNTILALDHFSQGYKHRVRLHFRSLSLTNVPFSRSLADAEIVFGQYQIKIEFATGMSLMLSPEEESTFNRISGTCEWVIDSGEYDRLHRMGTPAPPNDVVVYYVRGFNEADLLGCGGHAANRPACTVAANAGRWDTAHEVGHVLLTSSFVPVHTTDTRNLMHAFAQPPTTPVLTMAQVNKIRSSPCCTAI